MERRMQFNRPTVIILSLYFIVGIIYRYARTSLAPTHQSISSLLDIVAITIYIMIYGMIIWSVTEWKWPLSEWGFTIDNRLWISLVLTIGYSIIKVHEFRQLSAPIISFADPSLLLGVAQSVMEELIFRVFLIYAFIKLLGEARWQIAIAVFISATLFAFAHIPGKGGNELVEIWIIWFLMGFVVVVTRSLMFPAFVHVIVNTSSGSGLLGGVIFVVAYLSLAGFGPNLIRKFIGQRT